MTTVNGIDDFIKSILKFETPIEYLGVSSGAVLCKARAIEPALAFYVSDVEVKTCDTKTIFEFQYVNTEIKRQEIVYVDDKYQAEDAMMNAVEQFQKHLVLMTKSNIDFKALYYDFSVAYKGFYSNWTKSTYKIFANKKHDITIAVFSFSFRLGKVLSDMMRNELNDKIKEVSNSIFTNDMTPEIKAYVAHNYLARTVEYWKIEEKEVNPVERSYMQSAYGALVKKKCVCQGFAEAYKRLLDTQGIACYVVTGKIRGADNGHAWNIITFDNCEFFHIDVTWDIKLAGEAADNYFGCSDAEMAKNRLWTRRSTWDCSGKTHLLGLVKSQIKVRLPLLLSKGIDRGLLGV